MHSLHSDRYIDWLTSYAIALADINPSLAFPQRFLR